MIQSTSLVDAVAQAIAHHQAGRLPEAERLYRIILELQPQHPDANHNMGLLTVQAGKPEMALAYFKVALDAYPSVSQFWLSYIDALIRSGNPQMAQQVLSQGQQRGLAGPAVEALLTWVDAAVRGGEPFAVAFSHHMAGRLEEAVAGYRQALRIKPNFEETHTNLGIALFDLGRLEESAASYRHALEINPDNPKTNSNLGSILRDLGKLEEAEAVCRRAVEIMPDFAEAHYNLGIVLTDVSRKAEAEASYRRAVEIMPNYAQAHNNLGNTLRDLGRPKEAEEIYRRAVEIMPDFAEAHSNLGNTLRDLGRLIEAEVSCRRAIEIRPDLAEAHNKLGNTLYDLGKLWEAVECYRRALKNRPNYAEAHNNLGITLLDLGQPEKALESCLSALRINKTWASKTLFINCIKRLHFIGDNSTIMTIIALALTEPWGRPMEIMPAATSLVKLDPKLGALIARCHMAWPRRLSAEELLTSPDIAEVFAGSLLHAILVSAPIWDIGLERFLTSARHAMLFAASEMVDETAEWASLLKFRCGLAQQCFINEYVFDWTADEAERALSLRASLIAALEADAPISVSRLLVVAAYFPLNSLPFSSRLLDRPWPEAVSALLSQQISEPAEELEYRSTIPRMTVIEGAVSVLVRQQYEENPYPRWIKASPIEKRLPIDTILRRTFPCVSFKPLGKVNAIDVLIAGCGTGQQPIDAARSYLGARILAIDLSLSSLCYAKRKTAELGLTTIEYGQADIMKLGALDRSFDVIEASGVLHHLGDPLEGWRVLLGLLRPGGLMRIGLYSEVARRDVVRGRAFIAARNYGATTDDIRRCRQALMAAGSEDDFESLLGLSDFFSASACRDLLFHVQEHRMTLDGIDLFIRENGLQFLGFDIDRHIVGEYNQRFPRDHAATNLQQWQLFEEKNPDTFRSMYQFWVQKADQ